jgi:tetratricopeptide (TPR) repeat protein
MTCASRLLLVVIVLLYPALGQAPVAQAQGGIVVEDVSRGSAAERAGIRTGDIFLAWERPTSPPANPKTAEGTIESVFDWIWVEVEQGPRGVLKLRGERDGADTTVEIARGNWGVKVRPRFDDEALSAYLAGRAAVDAKELEKGLALWDGVAKSVAAAGAAQAASWMNLRIGDAWTEARRWAEADAAYASARDAAERASNMVAQAVIWDAIGQALERQGKSGEAERAYESAWIARSRASGESLSVAQSLNRLGRVAYGRRALESAEACYQRALAIQEREAPGSLDVAASLNDLGLLAWTRGDLASDRCAGRASRQAWRNSGNAIRVSGAVLQLLS